MRDVSNRFKNEQNNDNRNYLKYADITLADGTVINLTNADFWSNGMKFEDSVSDDNTFNIGSANINTLNLSINNFDEKYTDYDFTNAEVICYVGLEVEPTSGAEKEIEKIRICTMTVVDTPYQDTTIIELTCEDNMRKFDRDYSESKLKYPATRRQIIQDACNVCGVTLDTLSFDQDSYQITARPDDEALTFRQVIAWVCQIGCQYARCDRYGRLTIKWYDTEISDANRIEINSTSKFTPNLDDVVITGVRVTEYIEATSDDETASSYLYGNEGYVLEISENKLIPQGTGETVAAMIGEKCAGMSFRPFETQCLTDISIEAGDAVLITDRKGNKYKSFLTNVVLQPGVFEQISCNAESAARNSSKQYSLITQTVVDARKSVQKEKAQRELALEEFEKRLDKSSGAFTTIETQEDGSKIFYLHDKPQLSESQGIWKMTAEAWGVSNDGGNTWNGGMTVDGDTIARILNAVGVNANWINAGAITVTDTDGSILFSVDMDTKSVYLDGSVQIGGGKTLGQTFADYLQESKDYSDGKLSDYAETIAGSIGDLQGQIDGQIETFYYGYEPTLQNIPASDWTTTEERKKHIGDLFFNKTTGYAYRFMQDGAVWGWILVQDTDITKAMQAAQNAQDTADHKRRVFVTTPEPPYDIGDLWSQDGGDILTCTTARAKGAKYVESDWKKLNKYTDDTTAEKALEAASLARNMTMQLDNDYQGIPVDSDGNYSTFPDCTTTATVMYGSQDITDDCTYTITKSENVQGRWKDDTHTYTVTALTADSGWVDIRAAYLNNLVISKRFSLAKQYAGKNGIDGLQGIQGEKGEQGIPGKDGTNGTDGKTSYFHIKYSSVSNPTSSGQMTEAPSAYIGTYVDFTEADSNDPKKYTWSKFEGKDGEDGIPGANGADGKTYYLHIAYANSADGKTDFSTSNSTNKSYIGQYTDTTQADSTNPTKYSWTKIKGDSGVAGRTYFLQSNAELLLMGADKKISPVTLTINAFYRDGQEEAKALLGYWKVEKSSDGGNTYSEISTAYTMAAKTINIAVNTFSLEAHDIIRVSVYADKSKTTLYDRQSFSVAVDVAALTQEQIVDILSNNGTWKGLYYLNNHLYISFDAAKGGTLALGGANNGNGQLKIYDENGNEVLRLNNGGMAMNSASDDAITIFRLLRTGLFYYDSTGKKRKVSIDTDGLAVYVDYTDTNNYKMLKLGKYGLYAAKKTSGVEELWMEGDTSKKWEGYIIRYLNDLVRITANAVYTDGCSIGNNLATSGTLSVAGDTTLKGATVFKDYAAERASSSTLRRPVASASTDGSRVAYLQSKKASNKYALSVAAQYGEKAYLTYTFYYDAASDKRLKEDISECQVNALNAVCAMPVCSFNWKETGVHQPLGLVADDIEKIDPLLALGGGENEDGSMNIKQIDRLLLTEYAIKAIQELSAVVKEQGDKIKELEKKLNGN